MRHRLRGLAALMLAAGVAVAATAQPVGPAPVDAAMRVQVVRDAAAALRGSYVFPETGEQAAARIEAQLAAGAYDAAAEPRAFAQALTDDLQAVTHDKHLRISPAGLAPPSPAQGAGPPARSEGGVVRADRLPGGVGYLEVVGFPPLEGMRPSLDAALAALKGSKALIIDARRNGGGAPQSVAYLVSHFLGREKPILLNEFVNRMPGTTSFTTQAEMSVATPISFKGVPVIVLTSRRTFSGGEEFAYDMQAFKLATLVGETTGGGANPGGVRPLGPRFSIFIPGGRPVNAVTKTNWEGVGVKPDVAVPAAEALKAALQRLGQTPSSADIDTLSQAKLFSPRTTAQAGSDMAVRTIVERLAAAQDASELLAPSYAAALRSPPGQAQVADARRQVQALGMLQSLSFLEVDAQGFDRYRVQLAGGALDARILLAPDKKVLAFGLNQITN